MQQVTSTFFPFGPPVYINNIDPKYVEEMLQHVDTASASPDNYDKRDSLAGRIDDQYTIEPLTSEACKGHILQHVNQYNFDVGGNTDMYEISGLWVNIQRYMELNPMHSHDGMFSFVIFLKNELNREETINNKFDSVRDTELAGHLHFRYGEGNFMNWNVLNHWPEVGQIIIFPSWLQHMVMPHYEEDKLRISVAGNIVPAV